MADPASSDDRPVTSQAPSESGLTVSEGADAGRRTRLANERTYLAWWRTGLTSFAVCIGVGRIVPGISHVTTWPYQAVGAGYGVLGVFCVIVAHLRVSAVERAVDRGEFAPLDRRLGLVFLTAGLGLGTATIALVIFAT